MRSPFQVAVVSLLGSQRLSIDGGVPRKAGRDYQVMVAELERQSAVIFLKGLQDWRYFSLAPVQAVIANARYQRIKDDIDREVERANQEAARYSYGKERPRYQRPQQYRNRLKYFFYMTPERIRLLGEAFPKIDLFAVLRVKSEYYLRDRERDRQANVALHIDIRMYDRHHTLVWHDRHRVRSKRWQTIEGRLNFNINIFQKEMARLARKIESHMAERFRGELTASGPSPDAQPVR